MVHLLLDFLFCLFIIQLERCVQFCTALHGLNAPLLSFGHLSLNINYTLQQKAHASRATSAGSESESTQSTSSFSIFARLPVRRVWRVIKPARTYD